MSLDDLTRLVVASLRHQPPPLLPPPAPDSADLAADLARLVEEVDALVEKVDEWADVSEKMGLALTVLVAYVQTFFLHLSGKDLDQSLVDAWNEVFRRTEPWAGQGAAMISTAEGQDHEPAPPPGQAEETDEPEPVPSAFLAAFDKPPRHATPEEIATMREIRHHIYTHQARNNYDHRRVAQTLIRFKRLHTLRARVLACRRAGGQDWLIVKTLLGRWLDVLLG